MKPHTVRAIRILFTLSSRSKKPFHFLSGYQHLKMHPLPLKCEIEDMPGKKWLLFH
jgi:hypothetical protein